MRRLTIGAGLIGLAMLVLPLASCNANMKSSASSSASRSHRARTAATGEEDNLSAAGAPTVAGSVVAPGSGHQTGPTGCRTGDPLANVYHPNRLKVVQPCVTVSGTVRSVHHEDDGDTHFDLALDPSYRHLLTSANKTYQHGWLVAEIVPADETGCTPGQAPRPPTGTYNYGICTGADESAPSVRSHVFVTGPYVLDEDHNGWTEVHPVWAISSTLNTAPSTRPPATTTTVRPTTTTTPLPPPPTTTLPPSTTTEPLTTVPPPPTTTSPPTTSPPATSPPSTAGCYIDPEGNCYRAGEYCPEALRGQTVQGANGPIVCEDNDGWRWEPA